MNAPLVRPLALVVSLALAANAFAGDAPQPGTPEANAAAKRLYISATKHFDLAEYPDALNDFKEAYRLKDDPVFLYNIAQCYRILNKNDEALSFYRSYLRRAPDAPNRAEVEAEDRRAAGSDRHPGESAHHAEAGPGHARLGRADAVDDDAVDDRQQHAGRKRDAAREEDAGLQEVVAMDGGRRRRGRRSWRRSRRGPLEVERPGHLPARQFPLITE